jgi:hypothetical protein
MAIDSDPRRSAAHASMLAHLTAPFQGGATDCAVPITAGASATFVARVDRVSRQPLLLVGTRAAVGARGFSVSVQVKPRTPANAPAVTSTLRFAPWSEPGAFLPAWPGAALATPDVTPAFDVVVSVTGGPAGKTPIDLVELRLVEGVLGRLVYVMGAEKARLRRQGRELAALRRLDFTFDPDDANPDHRRLGHALDRLGADLGVPRLVDRMTWDGARQQPTSVAEREPNEAYRQRLQMFRPFVLPTRGRVEAGLRRFVHPACVINEANAELSVAIQLVSSPDDAPRLAFLDTLRRTHLVQPGQPLPAARPLPSTTRAALQKLLDRVGASFDVPAGASMAPLLAEALDRVGRCRIALGVTRRWKILRAQDDAGGSRYVLGLGVDVETPPAAELDLMATNLAARTFAAGTDVETIALLSSLAAKASAVDSVGRWLLAASGLRTVHPIAGGRVYLSHVAAFGAQVSRAPGSPAPLEAHFHAPGDPGQDSLLWHGLADVVKDVTAAGLPALVELAAAAAQPAITAAVVPTTGALAALNSAGLRTPGDAANLARAKTGLAALAPELYTTLKLDPALASGVLAGTPAQVAQLAQLVGFLRARELISVLPLVSGADLLLVVGAVVLPGAAVTLNSPRQGFRWYVLPVSGMKGSLERTLGARNRYTPPGGGASLAAVVAVSMGRKDREDPRSCIPPYQVREQLPADQRLDLAAYERLMNLLERTVPLGVVADTHLVREGNVDPAGSGQTVPFTGRLAHTFRSFEQRRHLGSVNPEQE